MSTESGNQRYTALYERLSRDDEQAGESNSILNQKVFLEEYFNRNLSSESRFFKHFTDDGYSGVSFERPGFNEMIAEIRAGHIDTVVVKDLSRLGRNYLQVGYFTEILFPDHQVRFIAVNNSVDSASGHDNELTPFINIMNEWYARDTSRKVRAILQEKMRSGKRINKFIPYGYLRDPSNHNHLIPDPVAGEVVKHIFEMAARGMGPNAIARQLESEKIPVPTAYARSTRPSNWHGITVKNPFRWNSSTLRIILEREEYLGHTILGRTRVENFKTKKIKKVPKEEQFIFTDTHEALIDRETWDLAQRLRKRYQRRHYDPYREQKTSHRLAGICYCADCGKRMAYHNAWAAHRAKDKLYDADSFFTCGTYRQRTEDCSAHYIRSSALEKWILDLLNELKDLANRNPDGFLSGLRSVTTLDRERKARENRKDLASMKRRISDLDLLIKRLYEDNLAGRISERLYNKLLKDYDEEESELEQRIRVLQLEAAEINDILQSADKFLRLLMGTEHFDNFSDVLVSGLVERIVVYESNGMRGAARKQRIDAWFCQIGYIDYDRLLRCVEEACLPEGEVG
ncbi:MAG: recombinase family protein [Lachnospiraceae bacterium]|nr:recombinase family protein [Lachnospiraceae bacterium]